MKQCTYSESNRCGTSGSSVIEYAVLLAIIISALLAMQLMIRAHLSGGWREALDQFGHGHQYEDKDTTSSSYTPSGAGSSVSTTWQ